MDFSELTSQAFTLQLTGEDEGILYRWWKGYSFPSTL